MRYCSDENTFTLVHSERVFTDIKTPFEVTLCFATLQTFCNLKQQHNTLKKVGYVKKHNSLKKVPFISVE